MKLKARPNLNGSTVGEFVSYALNLSDAISDATEAVSHIRSEVLNARNYQHIEGEQMYGARDDDIIAMVEITKALGTLRQLEYAILEIAVVSEEGATS